MFTGHLPPCHYLSLPRSPFILVLTLILSPPSAFSIVLEPPSLISLSNAGNQSEKWPLGQALLSLSLGDGNAVAKVFGGGGGGVAAGE